MEIWKYIKGYEGVYKISTSGNIISLKSGKTTKINPILHHTGYLTCRLYKQRVWTEFKVHRLVAEAFVLGEGAQVNHKDSNKLNNHYLNLENCSNRENALHRSSKRKKTSTYPGVSLCSQTKRWVSQCYFEGKQIKFGRFNTEQEAYEAYIFGCEKLGITNKYAK